MSDLVGESERVSYHSESGPIGIDMMRCRCGNTVGKWILWTQLNPARRFIRCKNFKDPIRHCKYRECIDPEIIDYYKKVIIELKEKSRRFEASSDYEDRMELKATRLMELDSENKGLKVKVRDLESEVESKGLKFLELVEENAKMKKKYASPKQKALEMQATLQK